MSNGDAAYRITLARELERRRTAAAQARYQRSLDLLQRLERRIARMREVFGDVGVSVPAAAAVGRSGRAGDYEAAAAGTAAAIRLAHREHEAAIAAARARLMVAPTFAPKRVELTPSAVPDRAERSADHAAPAAPEATPGPTSTPADARRQDVERLLSRLPGAAGATEVQRAEAAAQDAVGADDEPGYRRAFDRLRMTVQATGDRHREIESRTREVEELQARLDGLDGPDVDDARRRLDAADPHAPLPHALAPAVEAAAARAHAAQDQSFALTAVADTLTELGYEVGESFTTAVADGGAVVPLPRSDDHALEVNTSEGGLRFEVVRHRDTVASAPRDEAAERSWCDDHDRFVERVAEHGVELHFGDRDEPGAQPLRQVAHRRKRRTRRDEQVARSRARNRDRGWSR